MEDSFPMQRSYVVILSSLAKGTSFGRLCPHWVELLSLVSSPKCIGGFAGSNVRLQALKALRSLCDRATTDKNLTVLTDHFKNSRKDLNKALASCIDAVEEMVVDSKEEAVLSLNKECLERLNALSTLI